MRNEVSSVAIKRTCNLSRKESLPGQTSILNYSIFILNLWLKYADLTCLSLNVKLKMGDESCGDEGTCKVEGGKLT